MLKSFVSPLLAVLLLLVSTVVAAADLDAQLTAIQETWAVIKYQKPAKAQAAEFKRLSERTAQLRQSYPDRAEALIWDAIVLSSYAGAKGGLGALSSVKQARKELELAVQIDARALSGSAYTTLGSLYYKVPGWPIAFGSKKRASEYLQKALAIDPDGIDPNFFYGEFLLEEGKKKEAIFALERALRAPDRPGRSLADAGRREEIRKLLADAHDRS